MEYVIATHWCLSDFEHLVSAFIKQGWRAQGGVSVTPIDKDDGTKEFVYCQAMVK